MCTFLIAVLELANAFQLLHMQRYSVFVKAADVHLIQSITLSDE